MTVKLFNYTRQIDVPINITKFPGGETLVNVPDLSNMIRPRDDISITLLYKGAEDIMNLAQLVDILQDHKLFLIMPYVPYARQDRRAKQGDSHSLVVFAKMINAMGFTKIFIDDPHSDVVEALFPNAKINRQWDLISSLIHVKAMPRYDYVVSPDAGAMKKAEKLGEILGIPVISCTKKRDPATGKLSDPKVLDAEEIKENSKLLVVDDICDGGYTFIQLADALKKLKPSQIDLAVTHGIFSKGLAPLYDAGYTHVMCYNQIYNF